jgi:3-deoxy-manno-octulosonate cytidylyltransferase (CMP-KDO synthetase)
VSFHVVIPARYASRRFPGKPLADLAGKPMVVRVCERAAKSGAATVHVATDDERIAKVVREHGHSALMTRADHASGTDRLAEAAAQLKLKDDQVVVNVQGDEPLMAPALIGQVAALLEKKKDAVVSTASRPEMLSTIRTWSVVLDAEGYALYFSRSQIPYPREAGGTCYRHAGIYGYRVGFLKRFSSLQPSPIEKAEALEQLRVLWHGFRIAVAVSETEIPPGVDTPQDLEAVRRMFS